MALDTVFPPVRQDILVVDKGNHFVFRGVEQQEILATRRRFPIAIGEGVFRECFFQRLQFLCRDFTRLLVLLLEEGNQSFPEALIRRAIRLSDSFLQFPVLFLVLGRIFGIIGQERLGFIVVNHHGKPLIFLGTGQQEAVDIIRRAFFLGKDVKDFRIHKGRGGKIGIGAAEGLHFRIGIHKTFEEERSGYRHEKFIVLDVLLHRFQGVIGTVPANGANQVQAVQLVFLIVADGAGGDGSALGIADEQAAPFRGHRYPLVILQPVPGRLCAGNYLPGRQLAVQVRVGVGTGNSVSFIVREYPKGILRREKKGQETHICHDRQILIIGRTLCITGDGNVTADRQEFGRTLRDHDQFRQILDGSVGPHSGVLDGHPFPGRIGFYDPDKFAFLFRKRRSRRDNRSFRRGLVTGTNHCRNAGGKSKIV